MNIIADIKQDLKEQAKLGMITAAKLKKAEAYVDRNADEMIDMVDCQGCSISEATDIAVSCAF